MMQFIRQNVKIVGGVIVFVVAAFIGTIFLVWGRGGDTAREQGVAVWVGETPIYQREQESLYRNLLQFYQNIYKNVSSSEIDRRFDLRKSALDQLISRRAIIIEAGNRDIRVSDDEIRQKIVSNPAFQTDGRFDRSRYLQVTRALNQTPEQFEAGQRNDILIKKMESIIREGIKVTDEEVLEDFRRLNEKVSLDYVLISLEPFESKVLIEENDLQSYFEENRRDYFQPDRIAVEYIRIDPNALSAGETISEEDIALYYEEHSSEFTSPKKVRASHILFKMDPGAAEEEVARIEERARLVLEKAKGGADFASLAKEFSQDASGTNGGDLGFFSREQMIPEFSAAAFALQKGDISDLVKTQYGYHIIKVVDIKEPGKDTLEEARAKVAARLKGEIGREKARDLADRVNESLYSNSLQSAASEYGLEVKMTEYFAVEEPIPGLPVSREIKENILFKMNEEEVSEEIQWGGSRYFFQLAGRREGHLPELDEVREQVMSDLTSKKAGEFALVDADEIRRKIDGGVSPQEAASGGNYITGKTDPFTREDYVPGLESPGSLFSEAFDMEESSIAGPVRVEKGYVVCRIAEKIPISMTDFEEEKEEIKKELWETNSERFFQAWIEEIKNKIGVRIETREAQL